jgi:hypothetical protein
VSPLPIPGDLDAVTTVQYMEAILHPAEEEGKEKGGFSYTY